MQSLSPQVRRFQQIKAGEKAKAIRQAALRAEEDAGKTKIRQANPTLTENKIDAIYKRTMEIQHMNTKKG